MRNQDNDWQDPFAEDEKLQEGQIKLATGKVITLNEGQIAAIKEGREFLKSDRSFLTVSGSAGSGKTTVSQEILKGFNNVVVTAPTHKAKTVIAKSTGYPAQTIHKIVGLKPNVELEGFEQNNVLFDLLGKNMLEEYEIVLLDEASMLNSALVNLLKEKAIEHGIKIIFLGDARQLPPVGEALSRVFSDPEIQQIRLHKVERQQVGNPLISLYDAILSHIDDVDKAQAEMEYIKEHGEEGANMTFDECMDILNRNPLEQFKGTESISDGTGYKFYSDLKLFANEIESHFKIGEDLQNRIIAFRNDTVTVYNKAVRRKLLGSFDIPVQKGEFLMGYKTVTDPVDWRDVKYENSADYIVTNISEGYLQARDYDGKTKADIKGFFIRIKDLFSEYSSEKKVFIVKQESYKDFAKIEKIYGDFAKDPTTRNKKWAWKLYFDFRGQFALIGDIKEGQKKLVDKDFDFGYGQTVHKSQGSTYNNVFVIAEDILNYPDPSLRWRLMYVALSRPRKAAYILW